MNLNRKTRYRVQQLKLMHRQLVKDARYHDFKRKDWAERAKQEDLLSKVLIEMAKKASRDHENAFKKCIKEALEIQSKWSIRAKRLYTAIYEDESDEVAA